MIGKCQNIEDELEHPQVAKSKYRFFHLTLGSLKEASMAHA
jgi:hypothetical protein